MSNFASLNTALTGIRAGQFGLDTTSHNVSNANTPGYTRQRMDLAARPTYDAPVGPMGTGVTVEQIGRLRDTFLDTRLRTTTADATQHQARADLLRRAESVTGEPDAGIAVELDSLWDAFEDLANDPAEPAARQQVVSSLESLAGRFRSTASGWQALAADTASQRDAIVDEANHLLEQVAEINEHAYRDPENHSAPPVPNDLLDERDVALDRLAELTGARGAIQADNTITVTLGGETVVEGASAGSLTADGPEGEVAPPDAPIVVTTTDGSTPAAGAFTDGLSGELGAITDFLRNGEDDQPPGLPGLQKDLNDLAVQVRDALNGTHGDGSDPEKLLTGDDAEGLEVAIDPDALIAGFTDEPHDGRNAAELSGLRDGELNGQVRDLVTSLGGMVQTADRRAGAADELRLAANRARESAHGVSIDEEMVQMVRYQRSLEAASRVMTAVDQALDVLVNRTGLVGR